MSFKPELGIRTVFKFLESDLFDEGSNEKTLEMLFSIASWFKHEVNGNSMIGSEIAQLLLGLQYGLNEKMLRSNGTPRIALRFGPGSGWLYSGFSDLNLNQDVLVWLFRNVRMSIENNHINALQHFWEESVKMIDQHSSQYDQTLSPDDQTEWFHRRQQFKEFHCITAASILGAEQYSQLDRQLDYTTSQPPSYPLLPQTTSEIFEIYESFLHDPKGQFRFIGQQYNFPGERGLNADSYALSYVLKYIVLLLIRQFKLHSYFIYHNHTAYPNSSDSPHALNLRLTTIENMQYHLDWIINQNLIEKLDWDESQNLFEDGTSTLKLINWLDELKSTTQHEAGYAEIESNISTEKNKLFRKSISATILGIQDLIPKPVDRVELDGNFPLFEDEPVPSQTMEKDGWTDLPKVPHLNIESVLSMYVSANFYSQLTHLLFKAYSTVPRYEVDETLTLQALLRLGPLSKLAMFSNTRIPLSWRNNSLDVAVTENNIGGAPYIHLVGYTPISHFFMILPKRQLPAIEFVDLNAHVRTRFKFKDEDLLFPDILAYANLIDGNLIDDQEKEWLFPELGEDERHEKRVRAQVYFNLNLRYLKGANVVILLPKTKGGDNLHHIEPIIQVE